MANGSIRTSGSRSTGIWYAIVQCLLLVFMIVGLSGCADVKGDVAKARQFVSQGKYQEALAAYDNALTYWDKAADYGFTRADIEQERQETAFALADGHLDKALALMKEDKFTEAYTELEAAKEVAAEYERLAGVQEALDTTRKERADKQLKQAQACLARGDLDGAETAITAAEQTYGDYEKISAIRLRLAEKRSAAERSAYIVGCRSISYKQLKKDPDSYAGTRVKFTGEVLQIMEDESGTTLRLAVTYNGYFWDFNDVILAVYEGRTGIVEENVVTIYGEVVGDYTYKSQAGWDITVPLVKVEYFR